MKFRIVNASEEEMGPISQLLQNFLPYARKKIGFNRPPTIFFKSDDSNAMKLLGKTGEYNPENMQITIYTTGRHPKDVIRSLSHELVHHAQNCSGDLGRLSETSPGYAQTNEHLREMERQAYEIGNMTFRDWEDGVKSNKISIPLNLKESLIREAEEYKVVSGDTLSGIAKRFYGDASKWPLIYRDNQDVIGADPNLILPDQKFVIPDVSEWDAMSSEEKDKFSSLAKSKYRGSSKAVASTATSAGTTSAKPAMDIADGKYLFPVDGGSIKKITPYGMRNPIPSVARQYPIGSKEHKRYSSRHMHYGTDLAMAIGTPVRAPISGTVVSAGTAGSAGKQLILKGDDGSEHIFDHLSRFVVNNGAKVGAGDVIAKSGNTGASSGPHLHYELKINGEHVDPMSMFQSASLAEWRKKEIGKLLFTKLVKGNKNETK